MSMPSRSVDSNSLFLFAESGMNRNVLLIPEFCPGGQRQRLTVNKSTLLA